MLNTGNKTFMNLQEAVGWLLENNALPFQSTANYAGGVEIAMSTLINPSPAKVRVGSIIFFADSKVSTVVGVTSNSFIVSDQYNDLVDDIVYVSNVAINASGHLIVTLSNGTDIDAGLIKQVSNFYINASQHLMVSYNDGSTTDLGAIFNGDVSISGNLSVIGDVTGGSIIENMTGYSFNKGPNTTNRNLTYAYAGVVKNGNKITFAIALDVEALDNIVAGSYVSIGNFYIPTAIGSKLYPYTLGSYNDVLHTARITLKRNDSLNSDVKNCFLVVQKPSNGAIGVSFFPEVDLTSGYHYVVRVEVTFLLSSNLAS